MSPTHRMAWCGAMAFGMMGCTLLGLLIVGMYGPVVWALLWP